MWNIMCNSVVSENLVKSKDKDTALAYWKEMMPFATIKAVRTIKGRFNDNTANKEKRDSK